MIRVLVADDQAVVRTGFANLLATQDGIEVVGEAENGLEAVRMARETHPDVVLMDVRMPVMDGIEAARRMLDPEGRDPGEETGAPVHRPPKVLMLTTFALDEYIYEALAVGASGFLLKDTTFPELLNAVHVVARGEALLAPSVTKRLIAEFAHLRSPTRPTPSLQNLTARETEVLTLIARGLTNAEISARLRISDHTVKTHINRLFAKLDLRDRAQAVILAYELGLVSPRNGGPAR
ncbi:MULTISPECIES: response regulator [unclassified Streptomyces]|uniref:response regulator n=1 Tax=unclassified Streptomyces TaxID=2593676 RepID=UPI0004C29954|nr:MULTISPECIES: response regulator transcription factor [unclassified Streptomyces]